MTKLFPAFSRLIQLPLKYAGQAFWTVSDALIYPILLLIATPFFISHLGVEDFGYWMLINSVIAGLGVLNFGMSESVIKFVSEFSREDQRDTQIHLVNSITALQNRLSIVILGVFILSGIVVLPFVLTGTGEAPVWVTLGVMTLIIFLLRLYEQLFVAIYKGIERYEMASKWTIASKLSQLIVQMVALTFHADLVWIFSFALGAAGFFVIAEWKKLKKDYPRFHLMSWSVDQESMKKVLGFSLWSWGQSISGIIASQADRYIVAAVGGIQTFTFYSIGQMVASQFHSLFSSAVTWIFPKISRKSANQEGMELAYRKLQAWVVGAGLAGLLIFYWLSEWLIALWLPADVYANSLVYVHLFIVYAGFSITSIIPFYFMNGAGLVKLNTLSGLSGIALSAVTMPIGYWIAGPSGFVYGRYLVPLLIGSVTRTVLHQRLFNISNWYSGTTLLAPSVFFAVVILLNDPVLKMVSALLIPVVFYFSYLLPLNGASRKAVSVHE
ncbi:MAG: oligosaccharide flippase family protein [Bacteroidetes bacterium]|nr:oligosaccharide flippase family protein [Bacteroidota bacterium]